MVDNEVVENTKFPESGDLQTDGQSIPDNFLTQFARQIAIFSSDPRFMLVDGAKKVGSIWNGTEFVEPA